MSLSRKNEAPAGRFKANFTGNLFDSTDISVNRINRGHWTGGSGSYIVTIKHQWRFSWRFESNSFLLRLCARWRFPESPSRRQRMESALENAVNRPERPYRPAGSSDPRDRRPAYREGIRQARPASGLRDSAGRFGRRAVLVRTERSWHRRPGCRPQFRVRETDSHLERGGEHQSGGSLGSRGEPGHQHDLSGDSRPARGLRPGHRPEGLGEHL